MVEAKRDKVDNDFLTDTGAAAYLFILNFCVFIQQTRTRERPGCTTAAGRGQGRARVVVGRLCGAGEARRPRRPRRARPHPVGAVGGDQRRPEDVCAARSFGRRATSARRGGTRRRPEERKEAEEGEEGEETQKGEEG